MCIQSQLDNIHVCYSKTIEIFSMLIKILLWAHKCHSTNEFKHHSKCIADKGLGFLDKDINPCQIAFHYTYMYIPSATGEMVFDELTHSEQRHSDEAL